MTEENNRNEKEKCEEIKKDGKTFWSWKIDKQMLPYKVHFFLYIGAMGALLPYHPSIGITRLGLGAGNLAVVFTVQQFLFILFKPVVGYITDYFNNLKGMIVTLTIINGIFSYLLLVIPKTDGSTISYLKDSQLKLELWQARFCQLCDSSNELQKVAEYLPKSDEIFEHEILCENKSTVHETFLIHCSGESSTSSFPSNVTYKVALDTCYTPNKVSMKKRAISVNNLLNSSTNVYIMMYRNQSLSQFNIVCPMLKNVTELEKINFTVHYITKSCYKYPQDKIYSVDFYFLNHSESFDFICNHPELDENAMKHEAIKPNYFRTYQFWLYTLFLIISCTCTSCIFTLSDTACYETAQLTGADYGKQRAWGAVSWGLFAPFAGFLNDYTDSYWSAMILMTALCALQIWNLSKIDLVKPQFSQSILKDIKTVLSSPEFIAFEVGVFLNGMGIGVVWFFLAWFITDIGGSRLLIGLVHTVQCFLGEMPWMFFSGWLLKKVGHFNVVSMALVAHTVRFLAYSSLKDPWMILPIECLDGISFGMFYAAMTSYGKLNAKPGTEATTQSLLCSTYEGLGAGLGCVISGACFDYYGGYKTFFYAGLCCAAAAVINLSSSACLSFKKRSVEVPKEIAFENFRY